MKSQLTQSKLFITGGKESVKDFLEVHSWTAECFDKLQELYNQLSDEEKKKVKIFAVKIREKEIEQQTQKQQKQEQKTGEFTAKQETTAQSTDNGKLEIRKKAEEQTTFTGGLTEAFEVQGIKVVRYNDRATLVIDGKEYNITTLDYNYLKNIKDKIVSIKPQDGKIVIAYEDSRGKIQQKEIILQ